MKTMTQAEKTMLRYQYVMSNARLAMGDFAATANTWANVVRTLKQQFQQLGGIIGGTLINAIKPALIALRNFMQQVLDFAKTVADALGAIFGWTIEITASGSGAADVYEGLADSVDDAGSGAGDVGKGLGSGAKAAKAIEKSLSVLPFDELNQLAKDTGGSGGGSGGSGGSGGGSGSGGGGGLTGNGAQAALVRTDAVLEKITSNIKTLGELGSYISDSLVKAMKSINWAEIYANARNFGKGLAEFLNGLITPDLFGETAKLIARSINTAMYAINSFATEFHWDNLGNSIARGVNDFFGEWDAKTAGINIMLIANGVYEAIDNVLDNLDTTLIGNKIGTFLGEIKVDSIVSGITKLVNKIISKFGEIFITSFQQAPLQTAIVSAIGGLFVVSRFAPLATKLASVLVSVLGIKGTVILGAIALVSSGILDNLLQQLIKTVDSIDWIDLGFKIGQKLVDALVNVEWLKVIGHSVELIAKLGAGILQLIVGALGGIATKLGGKIADWFSKNYDFSITEAFFGNVDKELKSLEWTIELFLSKLKVSFLKWLDGLINSGNLPGWLSDLLNDKLDIKANIEAEITKQKDMRKKRDQYLEESGRVTSTDTSKLTEAQTTIETKADIYDRRVSNKAAAPIKTEAILNSQRKGPNFNGAITGMEAVLAGHRKGVGFSSVIGAMTSDFSAWKKGKGWSNDINMNSAFVSWYKAKGWGNNINMNSAFVSWYKARGYSSNIGGMIAAFRDWYKARGFDSNITMTAKITHAFTAGALAGARIITGYNGGIFKPGKGFTPFPSFASGGYPYGGQIFRARENGNPELVGTLRGSTAVMNNNQIVASVSDGVAKAIAGIRFQMQGFRPPEIDMNALGNMIQYAVVSALANNATERPIDVYATIKTQNDEVLARAVARGNRSLNYRDSAVAT